MWSLWERREHDPAVIRFRYGKQSYSNAVCLVKDISFQASESIPATVYADAWTQAAPVVKWERDSDNSGGGAERARAATLIAVETIEKGGLF